VHELLRHQLPQRLRGLVVCWVRTIFEKVHCCRTAGKMKESLELPLAPQL
ncbi:hypothetical protein Taro_046347, partial [Colocasia esculenta]|nr:hypothetical protein [Colocasia esculenta]